MSDPLIVKNDGPLIVQSNFWELPKCAMGKLVVSRNAGAFRILLPPVHEPALPDMAAAKLVILSRGPWRQAGLSDGVEILFDDDTSSPFALHLEIGTFDRLPIDTEEVGKLRTLTVWTQPRRGVPHKALERPARWRRVPHIPWLEPWKD
jgi:hypothetical protein